MTISPNALKIARQYKEMKQKDLADATKLTQSEISMIERGLYHNNISDEKIESLTKELGVTKEFLSGKVRFDEPKIPMQRAAKSGVKVAQENKTLAIANFVQQHIRDILENHVELEVNLPDLSSNIAINAEEAARSLRKIWGLGNGVISNLIALCESYGIIVFSAPFPTTSIVGFTMDTNTIGQPIVFLNEGLSTDRSRLTLAHELGHLVRRHDLAIDDRDHIEKEAWDFASEFLVPESELRKDIKALQSITIPYLGTLKRKWGVSMASLVMRLYNLGLINESRKQSLFVQLSRAGYRRKEPIELPRENETILSSMFEMIRTQIGLDRNSLSKELGVSAALFDELYSKYWGSEKTKLRLVK